MSEESYLSKRGISRRTFFKNASIAAGAGVVLSGLPAGASAYAGGSDRLKVGLIGCGGRGTGAANDALSADEGTVLVAMADAFRDRLDDSHERLSGRWGDTEQFDVPEEHKFVGFDAYQQVIELSDVVLCAATPAFRPAHFEAAVDAGKHVFMEKPVATDVAGALRVLEAGKRAEEQGLNVVVGLQRHYQDKYRETLRRIRYNSIGDIISGQVYWNSGGVWVRERQPDQSEMEYQMRNWYYFTWLSGDHILEQHIHQIDIANWFLGEYPESAQGMGGREVRKGPDHGQIFDHHFVEFTYPSGAVISSQSRHQPNTWSQVNEVFQGTAGTIDLGPGLIRSYNGNVIYEHDDDGDPNPYQQEHDELFAAIRNGDVIADAEHGAKSSLATIMGRMATYTGQVITWDQVMNSNEKLVPDNLSWDVDPPVLPDEEGNYPVPVPGQTEVV